MDFSESDIFLLKNLLDGDKNISSSSDDDLPNTSAAKLGPADIKRSVNVKITGNQSKEEPKEIRSSDPNNIWEWYEVPEVPHTDDIHADPRIKPEYDIKYKQFVATEDVYLQMGNKTPITASCEGMIIDITMKGENKDDIDCNVTDTHLDIRSPSYRLNLALPHPVIPDSCSAEWHGKTSHLIVNLTLSREYDFLNF
uniref:PIH1D1/2/3 CS-like domain-containing protein n=1 Tax=Panstrongylus lignarius TaxID=156445 RepID=A0A224XXA8_9HEMI